MGNEINRAKIICKCFKFQEFLGSLWYHEAILSLGMVYITMVTRQIWWKKAPGRLCQ